jgi:hypothetical protein
MPDPTRQTISATQGAALWNASPYVTRWMLYRHFVDGISLEAPASPRMIWGTKLQPLVLAQAAEELRLEVRPNSDDTYHRRGQLGCTRDGTIICPDRGPGALETKCCFDYGTWVTDWAGGKAPPRHVEMQLQQQMYVGDGTEPYRWGIIAAWIGGEVRYFERAPITDYWQRLEDEAAMFFAEVAARFEPDPFGAPVETPWLQLLFPPRPGTLADFADRDDAQQLADLVMFYRSARDQEIAGKRTAEQFRAKLLALIRDAEEARFAHGITVRASRRTVKEHVRKATFSTTLNVFVPELAPVAPEEITDAG